MWGIRVLRWELSDLETPNLPAQEKVVSARFFEDVAARLT